MSDPSDLLLSAPPDRWGPLSREAILALKLVRIADSEAGKRVDRATREVTARLNALIKDEHKATAARWDELAIAVIGAKPTLTPGHELFDVVEDGKTYLVARAINPKETA